MRPPLSLKGRALALLAQREQSVVELRRKLTRHARLAAKAEAASASSAEGDEPAPSDDVAERVEAVIAWLREHDYLSEDRFVESRVHARSSRFGQARIRQELAQHGLAMSPELTARLRDSELDRAAEVWRRKFGEAPADPSAQARQTRFLMARGFAADIVRRLVRIDRRADPVPADD